MKQREQNTDHPIDSDAPHDKLDSIKPQAKGSNEKGSADEKRDLLDEILEEHEDAWAELAKL